MTYGRNPFRNSRDAYLHDPTLQPHPYLVDQARKKAGPEVLDFGCGPGLYMRALQDRGLRMTGADIHAAYLDRARETGMPCVHVSELEGMPDGRFDSAILFDVLEHVADPDGVLGLVRRLTRRNVLISVPNAEGVEALVSKGLLFSHYLDLDHRHFFTSPLLEELLGRHFTRFRVERIDPVGSHHVVQILYRLRLLRRVFYHRLYAEVDLA